MSKIPIGTVFRRLTVIGHVSVESRGEIVTVYRCRCECGSTIRTTSKKLHGGQLSCGCARGGQRGQHNKPKKRATGYRVWTPEVEADALRLQKQGVNGAEIARTLNVPQTRLRDFLSDAGVTADTGLTPRVKALAEWPAGLKFEDVEPRLADRDKRGAKPRTEARYSLTGNSAALCCG